MKDMFRKNLFYAARLICAFVFLSFGALNCNSQDLMSIVSPSSASETAKSDAQKKLSAAEERANKLKEQSLSDSKAFHRLAKVTVDFTRENVSESLADILVKKIFGFPLVVVCYVAFFVLVGWFMQKFLVSFIFNLFLKYKSGSAVSESKRIFLKLKSPVSWFIIVSIADSIAMLLSKNQDVIFLTRRISTIFFFAIVCWALQILIDGFFKMAEERLVIKYAATRNLLVLGNRIVKYTVFTLAFIIILDVCGANITAVIASLGIGGAALAFASKDTIANFFGSVSLIIDRPFIVGDWISAGGVEGIVEFIGFRSTRIRTFPRTVVTIPNSVLANESVENWSKRNKRRADLTVGLTYSTTAEQMEEIVSDIKKLLENNPKVDSSDIRVHFTSFGDSSLNISIVYYVFELDANPYGNAIQGVNLDIMRAVQKRNLSFAFPSRSIYVETMPPVK